MNKTTSPCNDERLHYLLTSSEGDSDFHDASSHVESCHSCQLRLAELAADPLEWDKASQLLLTTDDDRRWEGELSERTWSTTRQGRPAYAWTSSLASQLLGPPSHPEMLGRLGRYEIERLIGAGGMGVVFKGFDSELNRPVAIKVLAPHLAGNGAVRERFAREARAAAAIVNEHVVAIHDVKSENEPPFLVMQYVAGESLQGRIDREGPLTTCEILRIAHQTAAGLAAAHEQGLVHRDVKPANVLLEQGVERALLSDFGLARASDDASLTRSGHAPGTPHFMSPEQARGDTADYRSDLFSLGSVIYTMCTGRPPFRAETSYGVLRRITDDQARPIRDVNAEMPDWLCRIVEKLHAKSVRERYNSAAEVAELLAQCLAHVQQPEVQSLPESLLKLPGDATAPNGENRSAKTRSPDELSRQPRIVIALCVAAVLLVGLIAVALRPPWIQRPTWKPEAGETGTSETIPGTMATTKDLKWNVAEDELVQVREDFAGLSFRVNRLWDNPSPARRTTSSFPESSYRSNEEPRQ